MKALVGAFNQEKALVGAFSVIVQLVVEPMEHYTELLVGLKSAPCVNAANVPVPCAAGFHYGKRAAEAEPEAGQPEVLVTAALGVSQLQPRRAGGAEQGDDAGGD